MDAEKLSNLLDDLKREESDDIASDLNELRDYFNQSMQGNHPEAGKNIDEKYNEIRDKCSSSSINELPISDFNILNKINGTQFYGNGLWEHLESILRKNQYNTQNIVAELEEFIKARSDFVKNVSLTIDSFKKFNIKSYYFTDDTYQIGVIIPEKGSFTTIPAIEKQLHNWNFVLKTLGEITNKETADIRISRVNNGSIELFFNQAAELADCIGTILAKIGVVYLTINEIRKHRKALKELKAPTSEQKAIEKHEHEILEKEMGNASTEIMKRYGKTIEQGRKQELSTALNRGIKFIARSIDNGIEVEIIPPYITSPEEIQDSDTEQTKKEKQRKMKEFQTRKEQAELIRKAGNSLKNISEVGQGIFKLLKDGDEDLDAK